MKQLRLTKQLEKQAKEAAGIRKAAEERVREAEESLSRARVMGAETARAESALTEATHAFSGNDFREALQLADRTVTMVMEAKRKRLSSIMASARELVDLDPAQVPASLSASMESCSRLIDDGDLDEAYVLVSQTWDRAEKFANRLLSESMGRAQVLLVLAGEHGLDVTHSEMMVSKARDAMENDPREALSVSQQAFASLKKGLATIFDGLGANIENRRVMTLEAGGNLSRSGARLQTAREMFSGDEVEDAFDVLEGAGSQADLELIDALGGAAVALRERLTSVGIIEDHRSGLEGLSDPSIDGLEHSFETFLQLRQMAREAEKKVVAIRIAGLKPRMVLGEGIGLDMTPAIGSLANARSLIRQDDLDGALAAIDEAGRYLDESLRGLDEVKLELAGLEELMDSVRSMGASPECVEDHIQRAREETLELRFDSAVSILREGRDILSHVMEERLALDIMHMELDLVKALKMGIDVAEVSDRIDELSAKVRRHEFEDSHEAIAQCHLKVCERMREASAEAVDRLSRDLRSLSGTTDMSSVDDVLDKAREELEAGDYERAHSMSMDAFEGYRAMIRAALNARMGELRRLLDISRSIGCESITLTQKYELAIVSRFSKEPSKVLEDVNGLKRLMVGLVSEELNRKIIRLSRDVASGRRDGLNVTEPERIVESSLEALRGGRIEAAYDLYQKAIGSLETTRTLYQQVYDRIVETSQLLESGLSRGKDVGKALSLLKDAKHLFEAGQYVGAAKESAEAYAETERVLASRIAIERLERAESLIGLLERMDVPSMGAANSYKEAKRRLDTGDDWMALDEAKRAEGIAEERCHKHLDRSLEEARSLLSRAMDVGLDPGSSPRILEKVESLMGAGHYNDAHRALELARMELDSTMSVEHSANEAITLSHSYIRSMGRIGVDVTRQLQQIGLARGHLASGRYNLSRELARQAELQAADMATRFLNDLLESVKEDGGDVAGKDLSDLIECHPLEDLILERNFLDAHRSVIVTGELIDRIRRNRDLCQGTLEKVTTMVEPLRAYGMALDTWDGEIDVIHGLQEEGRFEEANSKAGRLLLNIDRIQAGTSRRRSQIDAVKREMGLLADVGADVERVQAALDQAIDRLQRVDLTGCTISIRMAAVEASRSLETLLFVTERRRQELASVAEALGLGEIGGHEGEDLASLVTEVERLDSLIRGGLAAAQEQVAEQLSLFPDGDVAQELLRDSEDQAREGDLLAAYRLVREALSSLGMSRDQWEAFAASHHQLEELLIRGHSMGIPMDEAERHILAAEELRGTSPEQALQELQAGMNWAEKRMSLPDPRLAVKIELDRLLTDGEWSIMTVTIVNRSGVIARDLALEVTGDVQSRGGLDITNLPGGGRIQVRMEVRPIDADSRSVTARLTFQGILGEKTESFGGSRFRVGPAI